MEETLEGQVGGRAGGVALPTSPQAHRQKCSRPCPLGFSGGFSSLTGRWSLMAPPPLPSPGLGLNRVLSFLVFLVLAITHNIPTLNTPTVLLAGTGTWCLRCPGHGYAQLCSEGTCLSCSPWFLRDSSWFALFPGYLII